MLISFSIENFRSFSEEQTISLVASNKIGDDHKNRVLNSSGSKEKILRAAVIYGANGSGKSNLCKGLGFMKKMVVSDYKSKSIENNCFKFDDDLKDSSFDVVIETNNKTYRYGFILDKECVKEEWLLIISGNKEKVVFERSTSEEGNVLFSKNSKLSGKIRDLSRIGGPEDQTFLRTIQSILSTDDFGDDIGAIIHWFSSVLKIISPNDTIKPIGPMLNHDEDFLHFAGEFLKSSSTGVDHLLVDKEEISIDKLKDILPKEIFSQVNKDLADSGSNGFAIQVSNGMELYFEKNNNGGFNIISIKAAHKNIKSKVIKLNLEEESDGTKRLLQLIPALHKKESENTVYVIDEIDRSMHPILALEFIKFFLASCKENHNQIIMTTHESNLLDLEILRRDEIWFVEKDTTTLSSKIYPLSDFKVRTDLEVRKHYLQGRFGAIPFLGNISNLLQQG